ncbi:MAG TPA: hypothetical protein VGO96_01485, partial [Pyrinomonadaceae bacterium]|nr:hypothetical protein [Pyrinomonadaceae bacterium]
MKQFNDKIDEFLKVELKAHSKEVERFFERVQSNYDEAIRTATRFLLLMLAAWFLTSAIHEGWLKKIEWAGIKFDRKMTIVSPLIVGLLSYGMQSALAGAVVLWEAISRRLRYTLPTAWVLKLDDMLAPPTFSNVERMLEPEVEKSAHSLCSRGWFVFVSFLIFVGSVAGLVHTTYLLIRPSLAAHWAVIALSTTLGAIAWIRGVVLSAYAIEATGGFKLCHHRGERTLPPPDEELPKDNPQDSPPHSPSVATAPLLQQQPPSTTHPSVATT